MGKIRFLSVAAAEFALHMTLTILRKNKNTTTTNLLSPVDDLRLAQKIRTEKTMIMVDVRKSVLWNKNPSILSGYFQGKEGS